MSKQNEDSLTSNSNKLINPKNLNIEKIKVELDEWYYDCADGCCANYGTTTKVNGVEMPFINQDAGTIVKMVLEHLGFEVELIETYNGE